MNLSDLSLTPGQQIELETFSPEYVQAWLEATEAQGNAINSPAGWFLAGLRSGRNPGDPSAQRDASREKLITLAERETRNALLYCPDDLDYLDAIFGQHGRLKAWADDQTLRARMLALYHAEKPRAQQADQERDERAEKWREMNHVEPRPDREPIEEPIPW